MGSTCATTHSASGRSTSGSSSGLPLATLLLGCAARLAVQPVGLPTRHLRHARSSARRCVRRCRTSYGLLPADRGARGAAQPRTTWPCRGRRRRRWHDGAHVAKAFRVGAGPAGETAADGPDHRQRGRAARRRARILLARAHAPWRRVRQRLHRADDAPGVHATFCNDQPLGLRGRACRPPRRVLRRRRRGCRGRGVVVPQVPLEPVDAAPVRRSAARESNPRDRQGNQLHAALLRRHAVGAERARGAAVRARRTAPRSVRARC